MEYKQIELDRLMLRWEQLARDKRNARARLVRSLKLEEDLEFISINEDVPDSEWDRRKENTKSNSDAVLAAKEAQLIVGAAIINNLRGTPNRGLIAQHKRGEAEDKAQRKAKVAQLKADRELREFLR